MMSLGRICFVRFARITMKRVNIFFTGGVGDKRGWEGDICQHSWYVCRADTGAGGSRFCLRH